MNWIRQKSPNFTSEKNGTERKYWVHRIQSKEYEIQSTPDNSNLQGKQKKVRVIEGKIV